MILIKLIAIICAISSITSNFNTSNYNSKYKTKIPDEYYQTISIYKELIKSVISNNFEEDYNNNKFLCPSIKNSDLEYNWICFTSSIYSN